jgi:hypothetical protein
VGFLTSRAGSAGGPKPGRASFCGVRPRRKVLSPWTVTELVTVFARRDLQRLLDEATFAERTQLARLAGEINRAQEQSIDFEWELIVLAGLARLGSVVYEPNIPGNSNIDFAFTTHDGVKLIGDIATVSDKGYAAENPIDAFGQEFFRRVMKLGLSPAGFGTQFGGVKEGKYGSQRVRILVPTRDEYHVAFDTDFDCFLHAVASEPSRHHRFLLKNERWDVQITFDPNNPHVTSGHFTYTICHDRERNPLMHSLRRKARQLKKVISDDLRCIIITDGNSDLLRERLSYAVDQVRADQVITAFLSRNSSIDLVVVITIEHGRNTDAWSFSPGSPEIRVKSQINGQTTRPEAAKALAKMFARLPEVLPTPVTDLSNAVAQLGWRYPAEGRPFHGWYSLQFHPSNKGVVVRVGSRSLLELLAGRMDSTGFLEEHRHFAAGSDPASNVFATMLKQGRMIKEVQVEHRDHRDDDVLVFHFGPPDPAIAPLSASLDR